MEVSVIIPVFNAVDYIDQSIRSALHQPEVVEVIVIDDGSTDGSFERLQKWELKESKIKLLTHPGRQRKRAAATRNLGLKAATAEFIAFLDADDYYLPNRFWFTKRTLSKNPEANVIFEAVEIIKDEGSPLELPKDHILMMEDVDESKIFEYCLTSRKGHISPDGVTFKRSLLDKTGLMDEELPQKHDKDFILKLCLHGTLKRGIGGRKPVTIYRYHQSNTIMDINERQGALLKLYEKWVDRLRKLPVSLYGKFIILRHFIVVKNKCYDWPKIKKAALYPVLYVYTLFKNLNIFIPYTEK